MSIHVSILVSGLCSHGVQLSESSGQDKKTTLLHYLITQLHEVKPELLELPQELQSVSKSSESMFTLY